MGRIEALLASAGLRGPWRVALVQRGNDVYRADGPRDTFFVKLRTKHWYADARRLGRRGRTRGGASCMQSRSSTPAT